MALVLVFVGVMLALFLIYVADEGQPPGPAGTQIDGRTGEEVPPESGSETAAPEADAAPAESGTDATGAEVPSVP